MRLSIVIALLCLAAGTAAPAQRLKPPFGSQVSVDLPKGRRVSGELLAVDHDSIWVLQHQTRTSIPLRDVSQVRVIRGGMGTKGALLWSLTFGLVSGVALQSACSSVADDCSDVLPKTLLIWVLIGAGSAASLEGSRVVTVPAVPDSLRARARFPQGLPAAPEP
ncbi:MAG TPA: hypothetical protein VKD28_06795 [Gemmatimonadales bacterium]|nr:hypothetical protein [Gemmatimonadales bacterium]